MTGKIKPYLVFDGKRKRTSLKLMNPQRRMHFKSFLPFSLGFWNQWVKCKDTIRQGVEWMDGWIAGDFFIYY